MQYVRDEETESTGEHDPREEDTNEIEYDKIDAQKVGHEETEPTKEVYETREEAIGHNSGNFKRDNFSYGKF